MIGFTPEQLVALSKANTAAMLALTSQAFEGCEQVIQLNLQVARQALDDSRSYLTEALSWKSPEQAIAQQTKHLQSRAERALTYGGQLAAIASGIHAEWLKIVGSQYEYHARSMPRF
ncbi:phasin family protein [Burkholderia cepacia]|uniref:Phasin family protein n=1 Tax=Burkholderia cepacia GG4 TaxID=1009846 RepID=A0A9W3PBF0_BURCE|nr:phasin family protein [Burkholderia cepacia]AFQ50490.1 phasin family protein [Burkholderia cepacia GG4]